MLFNSIEFLIFFPLVTLIYFIIPHKMRWVWLLFSSYYFYMCWNPKYALLMATSTLITYLSGLLIDTSRKKANGRKLCKIWVALSFVSNLSILFFFKYFDFAVANLSRAATVVGITLNQPSFDVLLPVGISFYTFQALSYTMDVYRGDIYSEKNLGKYALFVSFFPQLVAGPIERSKNLLVQIDEKHSFDYDRVKFGLQLMLWGFFQKLVIADRAAILVNQVYNNYTQYAGFQIVVATVFFAVQIYCDFGGYSNIAIGAAQVMGFRLMNNFQQPYFATSIKDFWRRWHISLSTWFKDYLYIPLGGNRCSKIRKYCNLMVTFLASGLWHGASWNYVIWGGLHGFYQIVGEILKPTKQCVLDFLKVKTDCFSYTLLQRITTFSLVCFSWIFFRAPGAKAAFEIIKSMFSSFNVWIFCDGSLFTLGLSQSDLTVLIASVVILIFIDILQKKMDLRTSLANQNMLFRWGVYYALIVTILVFGIYGPSYDASQFIYFQF